MTNNRAQHVRNMREKCKSLNPVTPGDDMNWYIQLVDRHMKDLYKIVVFLPREFPNVAPQVSVSHTLDHPWVDSKTKVVMNAALSGWSNRNDAGTIIVDILREFTTKKPAIGDHSKRNSVVQEIVSSNKILETVAIPSIPSDFPELTSLKEEELELLDSDASVFDGFITNLAIVSKYRQLAQDQMSSNQIAASKSVQMHEDLLSVQEQLGVRKTELVAAIERVTKLLAERDTLMMKFTQKTLRVDLGKVIDSTDTETSKLLSATEFVLNEDTKAAILQERVLHHKAKSLNDLISIHSGSKLALSPTRR